MANGVQMPLELGLWRVDGPKPQKLASVGVPLEVHLEKMIEADPTILGEPLLLIGRQVSTADGKILDLLAVDADGSLVVIELKRDRTSRDVIAQALDYGSWVSTLTHQDVLDKFHQYRPDAVFEQAFTECFGRVAPDELNSAHRLTIIANEADAATERIVGYLAGFNVPVNVAFFRYFEDAGRAYLARTWLLDISVFATSDSSRKAGTGSQAPWNGTDWYVSFGEYPDGRNWDDARQYGFVSAGGGEWFSKTIRGLPVGACIFACIPKLGYVGVGTVLHEAQEFDEAIVTFEGTERRLAELPLLGKYTHVPSTSGENTAEYVVSVRWQDVRHREDAVWVKGMFANQNSACKLRNKFTIDTLYEKFNLDEASRET